MRITPRCPGTKSVYRDAQGSSAKLQTRTRPTSSADLATGVQTLLSTQGRFNMDRKAALLQATDFPERLDQIQLYLDAVHNRATRQVQIQAKVIEVVLDDAFAAGLDWPLLLKRAGDAVSLTQTIIADPAAAP